MKMTIGDDAAAMVTGVECATNGTFNFAGAQKFLVDTYGRHTPIPKLRKNFFGIVGVRNAPCISAMFQHGGATLAWLQ